MTLSPSELTRRERLKSFGYTHLVSFVEHIPHLGNITKAFPTTEDAVDRTVERLNSIGMKEVTVVTL